MRYLIVGGGIAGVTAARRLKALSPEAEVTIIESEPRPYYLRPGLIDLLAGEKSFEEITPFDAAWYEHQGITYRTDATAVALNPASHTLTLASGEVVPYHRLLIATGAEPNRPPIPGADLPGVYTLRTAVDAERITTRAQLAKSALMIGGGWLGLEAARALRARNLPVKVLELAPWLLARQLDQEGSAVLEARLRGLGIEPITGTGCSALMGKREVETAVLEGGVQLEVDLVVISAGIRPRTALAAEAGVSVNRGVIVNALMRTSAPDVFACGDVAEWQGRIYGIIPAAREQATVAAANMVEEGSASYSGTVPSNRLKVAGLDLICLGDTQPQGGPGEEHRFSDPNQGIYRKIVVREGKLVGAVFLGEATGAQLAEQLIREGGPVQGLIPKLLSGEL